MTDPRPLHINEHHSVVDERAQQVMAARAQAGLVRVLRARRSEDTQVDFASNDYLGLSTHPQVQQAAAEAALRWGVGSTGSRLVTGHTSAHHECEQQLSEFMGWPSARIFSSGYLANLGVVTALGGKDCLIISDSLSHASLVDACRLSRSPVQVIDFAHTDEIRHALATRSQPRALLLTDSVVSTTGKIVDIASVYPIARRYGAALIVDEAHGLGVVGARGQGVVHHAQLSSAPDLLVTTTLSKSLGSQGGAVLGSQAAVELITNTARSFIFDTGLNLPAVAAASQAVQLLDSSTQLVDSLHQVMEAIGQLVGQPNPSSAVISHIIGDAQTAYELSLTARDHGLLVGCFRPPSVPQDHSLLRFTARASHTPADIAALKAFITTHVGETTAR